MLSSRFRKNIEKNYPAEKRRPGVKRFPAEKRRGESESDCGVLNTEQHGTNRETLSAKDFNLIL